MPLPVFWEDFAYRGRGNSVKHEVGYEAATLEYVWQKYGMLTLCTLHFTLSIVDLQAPSNCVLLF